MKISVNLQFYRGSINAKEMSTLTRDILSVARFHFIYTIILDYKYEGRAGKKQYKEIKIIPRRLLLQLCGQ